MSLFTTLQIANNALRASQIGIQVAGNNIANANTPGYIRQEVILTPAPTQQVGGLLLGLGVQVQSIVQKIDLFLEERLRGAISDLANGEAQEQTYLQLEALIGELGDTDLSTSLTSFFASIQDILNQPENIAVRNLAALQGRALADDISRLSMRVREVRADVNNRIIDSADEINRLTQEIARLNVTIVEIEGSDTSGSDAVGLRDKRLLALSQLAKIIDIRTVEQPTGSVSVFVGGDFLVLEGISRDVTATTTSDRGLSIATIQLDQTNSPIASSSGELGGLTTSRDQVLGGFLDKLDDLAAALIFGFNQVFSSGQGQVGYSELTSEFTVDDADFALDAAGLTFTPVNGAFQVQVLNTQTGLTKTTDVKIDLHGLTSDTSLNDLAAVLTAIEGISAQVTASRTLQITSDSSNVEFAFADDTSGILASLGIATFFTGTTALSIGVNQQIIDDPSKFAASRGGIGKDSENAVLLGGFLDKPLDDEGGISIVGLYERLTGETTQAAAVARSVSEGFLVFQLTLEGQKLAISGVSLDEEAIKLIVLQRSFQAAARLVSTLSELLDVMMNL